MEITDADEANKGATKFGRTRKIGKEEVRKVGKELKSVNIPRKAFWFEWTQQFQSWKFFSICY